MMLWVYLVIGTVAGLSPPRWFWGRGMQFLDGAQLRSRLALAPVDSRRRRRWWKSTVMWADPLRGAAAGWMLTQGVRPEIEEWARVPYLLMSHGVFAVLAGFVIVQCMGRLKEGEILGPVLFLGGLTAGFGGWVLGACGLAVGLLTLLAAQSVGAALLAMAVTMAAAGWFLVGFGVPWLAGVGLCGLPLAWSFFSRHRLVVVVRG